MKDSEKRQKVLFDNFAVKYSDHFNDKYSRIYRKKFIDDLMFKGIDLKGKLVLDAMCGAGTAASYLQRNGAFVVGQDLSFAMLHTCHNQNPDSWVIQSSVLGSGFKDKLFDVVIIQGGLHHIHPFTGEVTDEVYRILKPGGYFCFSEPYKGSLPDLVRRFWYKKDPFFEKNESAVDLDYLMKRNAGRFDFLDCSYMGGLAYLLVYNSMIFRIPLSVKKFYSPALIALDTLMMNLQGRVVSFFAVCRWRKKVTPDCSRE
ncbi:MAG: class I SAM-dependent methyltransferase [Fibrobacter sp.]|nr:class I SAM-dependent methyltransferase [Fibrobacter sp.]